MLDDLSCSSIESFTCQAPAEGNAVSGSFRFFLAQCDMSQKLARLMQPPSSKLPSARPPPSPISVPPVHGLADPTQRLRVITERNGRRMSLRSQHNQTSSDMTQASSTSKMFHVPRPNCQPVPQFSYLRSFENFSTAGLTCAWNETGTTSFRQPLLTKLWER